MAVKAFGEPGWQEKSVYTEMKSKRPFKFGKQLAIAVGRQFPRAATVSMVAAVVALVAAAPSWAAVSSSDLEKLEKNFFHHTYPKDTSDARLDRLEKMVFGEAKEGADSERLSSLMKLVPEAVNDAPVAKRSTGGGGSGSDNSSGGDTTASDNRRPTKASAPAQPEPREDEGTQYPAVSAIEKKLFGKEFNDEAVETRLTRLEKKAFGRQSSSTDLSDRMDALKSQTGIDIARHPGPTGEWNDEEDEDTDYPDPTPPVSRRYPGVPASDSGRSFSGRDVGGDLNRAFGRRPGGTGAGGSGSYGMGGSGSTMSSGSSGSYGFGGGSSTYGGGSARSSMGGNYSGGGYGNPASASSRFPGSQPRNSAPQAQDGGDNKLAYAPPTAPTRGGMPPVAPSRGSAASAAGGGGSAGLSAQLDALENQVFGKTYQEPMIQRLDRLDTTVFPSDKSARSRTPAERVARLAGVLGGDGNQQQQPMARRQSMQQDYDGDGDMDGGVTPMEQQPSIAQQSQRNRGGLGKIINSLGSFLGGATAGSYATGSNLVTDPQTGMLLDAYSGNLINPTTGQVVGRRAGYTPVVPNYGMNSFNNGFSSPYYSPYSTPGYGIGGGGIRFGGGGMGIGGSGIRFGSGGMWP